jgi:hypothetical protein
MARADEEATFLSANKADIEGGAGRQASNLGDEELDAFGVQVFQQMGPGADLHPQAQLWMAPPEFRQHGGQQGSRWKGSGTEAGITQVALQVQRRVALQAAGIEQQLSSTLDQERAGGSGPHSACFAVEQSLTQLAFQRLDAAAESRLAQMHTLGCACEMAFFRQGKEVADAPKVEHGPMLSSHWDDVNNAMDA